MSMLIGEKMNRKDLVEELNRLKESSNYRSLVTHSKATLNLSSNDYLGIGSDKNLREEFYKNYLPSLSSSSSRLIDGSYKEIMELEKRAEEIYGKPCIMFNSGYDANSSLIETFSTKDTLILTDRLNHASIYDGIVHSKATFLRYKHLDLINLEELLKKYRNMYDDILVISESIYSMDGDNADIEKLVSLKKRYKFNLMIDEAHSYGVHGYGISYNLNLVKDIDFLVIPLGKGGGSVGAMVFCEGEFKEYIVNRSRKFIYSTALPPINSCWNLFILNRMNDFEERRAKLEILKNYTLKLLKESGIKTESTTHIISIVIGDNERVVKISDKLRRKGYILYPIKEPTVPKGTARFRIGLNPNITHAEIEKFIEELKDEINSVL